MLVRVQIALQRQESWHGGTPAARVVFLGNSFRSSHFFFHSYEKCLASWEYLKKFNFLSWLNILVELHFFCLVYASSSQDYFNPNIFPGSWLSSRNWGSSVASLSLYKNNLYAVFVLCLTKEHCTLILIYYMWYMQCLPTSCFSLRSIFMSN